MISSFVSAASGRPHPVLDVGLYSSDRNNELMRLNVDIATLQETRLADSWTLKENDYKL